MQIFRDDELLKQASPRSTIYISLEQQRGRLYVNNQVAMDWPVSTGVSSRPTTTGSFTISQKKEQYASNRYGKIVNAEGKCVNSDADSAKDAVPEGGKFVGAPMPYWQRLTGDGIGMHTGKVRAGRRLSHGCIRTPNYVASRLFKITASGVTRVHVVGGIESCYPGHEAMKNKRVKTSKH